MPTSGTKKMLRRIGLYAMIGVAALFHFMVTFVVILFVLSTVNIANQKFLHIGNTATFEKAVAALIFIISAIFFLRSVKRISRFIRLVIFKDPAA
ncbi:MAG: hypothetical protein GXP46_06840 [Deferribacteres bacterium]|nr:hypothetical protein [Deferribacteres bacterium]